MSSLNDYSFLFSESNSEQYYSQKGWGPSMLSLSAIDIPFAPFSKNDKLCRVADWQSLDMMKSGHKNQSGGQRDQRSNNYGSTFGAGASNYFSYHHVDDETTFSTVDTRTTMNKKMTGRMGQKPFQKSGSHFQGQGAGQGLQQQRSYGGSGGGGGASGGGGGANGGGGRSGGNFHSGPPGTGPYPRRRHWRDMNKSQRLRESSIVVGPDWKIIEEIEFSRLSKLQYEPDAPEELAEYGTLHYYDRLFDRTNTKSEKNLIVSDKYYQNLTTSDDPILTQMSAQGLGNVFATDSILSLLMAAPRSVFPWDLIVRKEGEALYLDKRDATPFDFLAVNETAAEPPIEHDKDHLNSASALAMEAMQVNRSFADQVLKENDKVSWPSAHLEDDQGNGPHSAVGYRYRRWQLGDTIQLVVRTETDALLKSPDAHVNPQEPASYITIRAMNETDPKLNNTDWRQKLDSQRGSVLATEVRNNGNKLARWVYQSLLSGSDFLKLGFISRVNPKDRTRHVILGTSQYKPEDFASQINLSWTNGYGILKALLDVCLKLPSGLYVLLKDPNKSVLRLYALPAQTRFEGLRKDAPVASESEN